MTDLRACQICAVVLALALALAGPAPSAGAATTKTRKCGKSATGWTMTIKGGPCRQGRKLERNINRHLRAHDEYYGWYFEVRSGGRLFGCKMWPRHAWCKPAITATSKNLPFVRYRKR